MTSNAQRYLFERDDPLNWWIRCTACNVVTYLEGWQVCGADEANVICPECGNEQPMVWIKDGDEL